MRNTRLSMTALAVLVGCAGSIAQAASPAVEPDSSKPVSVVNTTLNPAPLAPQENPDGSPYAESGSATLSPPFVNNFISFPTPPGYRYFIEQASVTCTTPSSTDVFTQAQLSVTKAITPTSTQGFGSPVVVLKQRGPAVFGGFLWTGTAKIKLISDANPFQADGSGALFFNIFHTDTSVTASCFATLFGHTLAL